MTHAMAPERPPSKPRRRVATAIGVILLLSGLGVVGYFAWQYIGTNIVAKHKQAEIKKETKIQWEKGVEGDAIAMLRVKRFGDLPGKLRDQVAGVLDRPRQHPGNHRLQRGQRTIADGNDPRMFGPQADGYQRQGESRTDRH